MSSISQFQQQLQALHQTVLLNEAVDCWIQSASGIYVDGTFGRGGHSALACDSLNREASLFCFDRDQAAVSAGLDMFASVASYCQPSVEILHSEFSHMRSELEKRGKRGCVDGILLDIGVSSPQIDNAERGFSFSVDGPLDMRMNPDAGQSAAEWLAAAELQDIAHVLKYYGEEKFAKRIATGICEAREVSPIESTLQLAKIIDEATPVKDRFKHPATRSFQAIRIYINDELGELERTLDSALDLLAVGGRLVVISFHSLEDRMVKRFMRERSSGVKLPKNIPVLAQDEAAEFKLVGKAIKASQQEVQNNPRSRSAVMRVLQRVSVSDTNRSVGG